MTPFKRLILPLLLVLPTSALALDTFDRSIEPTARVGLITDRSTEADLMSVYGSTSVKRVEGEAQGPATLLFPGTPDELRIEWKDETGRFPRRIVVGGGAWHTTDGLAVGTTLAELEKINGGPFDVTGANWDRPIRVVSWKGGNLPPRLQVDLGPADNAIPLPTKLKSQRAFFESTHPLLAKSNLVVKSLILYW